MDQRFWTAWSFLILGFLTAAFGAVMLTIRLRALQTWTHVQGVVTDSVVLGPDMDDEFFARITVRWQLNGSESKEFNNWGRGTGRADYEHIVSRYPKGSSTPILCEPASPSHAFLDAGYSFSFLIVPSLVVIFGLGAALLGYLIKPGLLSLPAR